VALEVYTKPYVDSSVWLGWIKDQKYNGISGKDVFEHILFQAKKGDFKIHTSSATLAEVHKIRGQEIALTTLQDDEILAFFEHDFIRLIDVDREIGENANKLCRDSSLSKTGASLKPFDAIHLASALKYNCDYLLCWDGSLAKFTHPKIIIEQPQMRGQSMFITE
jgi:predicted nucleic acid-binding protein